MAKKNPSVGLDFDPNSGRHFFFFFKSLALSVSKISWSAIVMYNIKIIIIITATTTTTTIMIIIIMKIIL